MHTDTGYTVNCVVVVVRKRMADITLPGVFSAVPSISLVCGVVLLYSDNYLM